MEPTVDIMFNEASKDNYVDSLIQSRVFERSDKLKDTFELPKYVIHDKNECIKDERDGCGKLSNENNNENDDINEKKIDNKHLKTMNNMDKSLFLFNEVGGNVGLDKGGRVIDTAGISMDKLVEGFFDEEDLIKGGDKTMSGVLKKLLMGLEVACKGKGVSSYGIGKSSKFYVKLENGEKLTGKRALEVLSNRVGNKKDLGFFKKSLLLNLLSKVKESPLGSTKTEIVSKNQDSILMESSKESINNPAAEQRGIKKSSNSCSDAASGGEFNLKRLKTWFESDNYKEVSHSVKSPKIDMQNVDVENDARKVSSDISDKPNVKSSKTLDTESSINKVYLGNENIEVENWNDEEFISNVLKKGVELVQEGDENEGSKEGSLKEISKGKQNLGRKVNQLMSEPLASMKRVKPEALKPVGVEGRKLVQQVERSELASIREGAGNNGTVVEGRGHWAEPEDPRYSGTLNALLKSEMLDVKEDMINSLKHVEGHGPNRPSGNSAQSQPQGQQGHPSNQHHEQRGWQNQEFRHMHQRREEEMTGAVERASEAQNRGGDLVKAAVASMQVTTREIASVVMDQIERLRESRRAWTRVTFEVEGRKVAMHLKMNGEAINVRFGEGSEGVEQSIRDSWKNLASRAKERGYTLGAPEFSKNLSLG